MKLVPLSSLVIWIILFGQCQCRIKIWNQNINLATPDLWEGGRLPCQGQPIILPSEVISIPENFVFGSKVFLPDNGMLLFPQKGSISLVDEMGAKCSNTKMAKFRSQIYRPWFDPSNWMSIDTDDQLLDDKSKISPIPHLERIPCRFDDVKFPTDKAFKAGIFYNDVDVSTFRLGNLDLSSEDFRAFYSSGRFQRFGKMLFSVNTSMTAHGDQCSYPEGCECGTQDFKETICSMKGAQCPYEAKCSSALMPTGHCCYDVCGGVIHIDLSGGNQLLHFELVKDLVQANIYLANADGNPEFTDFMTIDGGSVQMQKEVFTHNSKFYMSKVSETELQIVIVDGDGDTAAAVNAARDVFSLLEPLVSGAGMYIWMEESGIGPPSALKRFGKVFGILVAILAIGFLIFLLAYGYTRFTGKTGLGEQFIRNNWTISAISSRISSAMNRPRSSLNEILPSNLSGFSRFQNESPEMELGLPDQDETAVPSISLSLPSSAVAYRELEKIVKMRKNEDDNDNESKTDHEPDDSKISFSNPMYESPEIFLKVSNLGTKSDVNIYSPDPIKKQEKKKSTSNFVNPMFDLMVDISGEANKNQDEEEKPKISTDTETEGIYETISSPSETGSNPLIDYSTLEEGTKENDKTVVKYEKEIQGKKTVYEGEPKLIEILDLPKKEEKTQTNTMTDNEKIGQETNKTEKSTDKTGQIEKVAERATSFAGKIEKGAGATDKTEQTTNAAGKIEKGVGASGKTGPATNTAGKIEKVADASSKTEQATTAAGKIEKVASAAGKVEKGAGASGKKEPITDAAGKIVMVASDVTKIELAASALVKIEQKASSAEKTKQPTPGTSNMGEQAASTKIEQEKDKISQATTTKVTIETDNLGRVINKKAPELSNDGQATAKKEKKKSKGKKAKSDKEAAKVDPVLAQIEEETTDLQPPPIEQVTSQSAVVEDQFMSALDIEDSAQVDDDGACLISID